MSSLPRRERERNELREKILAVTRTLLVEGGVDAVTMREVARRVEYSPAALYQHFADKEALIHELCLADYANFAALFLELRREGGSLALLCRAGLANLRFARDFPEHYRFMFLTQKGKQPPDSQAQREDPAQNAYVFLHGLVEVAIKEGLVREQFSDSHVTAQTLWAIVHGAAALDLCRPESESWIDFRPFELRAQAAVMAGILAIARDAAQAERVCRMVFEEQGA
ncbi:MAG TPA: TetR/AcrR family transcriptional regulator [Polyangiaceae bacterium]|nr:TetR/AcrR family transcriptional regulator [Polyangiaceae bacterium]